MTGTIHVKMTRITSKKACACRDPFTY